MPMLTQGFGVWILYALLSVDANGYQLIECTPESK